MEANTFKGYTNSTSVSMSAKDLQLGFYFRDNFELSRAKNPEELGLGEPVAVISMSTQHAKSLMLIMQRQIEGYEEQFGPIPIEPVKNNISETE
jgi:hypothetical protein